jgi:membrane-associated phospholipid phosphatase
MGKTSKSAVPAIVGVLACAAAVVALMLVVYEIPGPQRLDATALHGFNTLEGGPVGRLAEVVLLFGGFLPLGLALIPLYVLAGRWGRRPEAIAAIAVVVLANLTTETMKIVLAHPRFQPILGAHQVNAGSFPSGHATSAMSMAVATLLVVPPLWRRPVAIGGAVLIFAVSSSVLVLAWHFPSDVLGGILVATGYGFAAVAVLRRRRTGAGVCPIQSAAPRRPFSRTALEAVGLAALCALAAGAVAFAPRILSYTDTYTTTVVVALVISATAAALLALFSVIASERA